MGGILSRVLGHAAPSRSTNAALFICPLSSKRSRCVAKLDGSALNRGQSPDHAQFVFRWALG
jgi:hypothetical protein